MEKLKRIDNNDELMLDETAAQSLRTMLPALKMLVLHFQPKDYLIKWLDSLKLNEKETLSLSMVDLSFVKDHPEFHDASTRNFSLS